MERKEFIINNITKDEFKILKKNNILYYPYGIPANTVAVIYCKDEYLKAVNLLGRY